MITATGLRDKILEYIEVDESLPNMMSAIKVYIDSNIEITGNYVGVTPTAAPDPLSGPVSPTLNLPPVFEQGLIVQSAVLGLVAPNPNLFLTSINTEIIGSTVLMSPPFTGVGPFTQGMGILSPSEIKTISERTTHSDVWLDFSAKIIDMFLLGVIAPIPTTTASGAGTTTIVTIK